MNSIDAANILRAEGTAILEDRGLRALLESFGRVVVHGSYALDLMAWRDLDIYLCPRDSGLDVSTFFSLGSQVAQLLRPHRMHFRDETRVQTEGLPKGLYWGLHLPGDVEPGWKIDLWAIDEEELRRLTAYQVWVAERLTPASRAAILAIKSVVCRHSEYRRRFGAKHIYDAVLGCDVTTLDGFAAYVENATGVRFDE
jgi:hypothetical protein